MKKIFLITIISFLASGCGIFGHVKSQDKRFDDVLATWVGQPASHLIEVWGIPDQTFELGSKKYFAYLDDHGRSGFAVGTGNIAVGSSKRKLCKTTFTLEKDKVVTYQYDGNSCGD